MKDRRPHRRIQPRIGSLACALVWTQCALVVSCGAPELDDEYVPTLASIRSLPTEVDVLTSGTCSSSDRHVEAVAVRDYLLSVLPCEAYASWDLAALKAQAVASYSYLAYWHQMRLFGSATKVKGGCADLTNDQRSQVFGCKHGDLSQYQAKLERAVDETSGEVLVRGGELFQSEYCPHTYPKCPQKDSKGLCCHYRGMDTSKIDQMARNGMDHVAILESQYPGARVIPASYSPSGGITPLAPQSIAPAVVPIVPGCDHSYEGTPCTPQGATGQCANATYRCVGTQLVCPPCATTINPIVPQVTHPPVAIANPNPTNSTNSNGSSSATSTVSQLGCADAGTVCAYPGYEHLDCGWSKKVCQGGRSVCEHHCNLSTARTTTSNRYYPVYPTNRSNNNRYSNGYYAAPNNYSSNQSVATDSSQQAARCSSDVDGMACSLTGHQGLCATGRLHCIQGAPVCEPLHPEGPQPEQCDDLDHDCDGDPHNVSGGCSSIAESPKGADGKPPEETCNNKDDDSNGYIDDGIEQQPCQQDGRDGIRICANGVEKCTANPVPGTLASALGSISADDGGTEAVFGCSLPHKPTTKPTWLTLCLLFVYSLLRRRRSV